MGLEGYHTIGSDKGKRYIEPAKGNEIDNLYNMIA
jgi:hypothetical protein